MTRRTRREFIRDLGLSSAALPFVWNLPAFSLAAGATPRKQRLVLAFSPNGTIPPKFWPDEEGPNFKLKEILEPLAPYQDRMLILKGISNKVRGDGDSHMRGMSCLWTGAELFPGNIQGGSHTPAGWASGISIDQEIARFFQSRPETRTRFRSLEFGVVVGDRADPWTRMSYAGPNQPVTPVDDPYQMFEKLYGRVQDQKTLRSVLDDVREDLARVRASVGAEDRRMLDEHVSFVRDMERDLQAAEKQKLAAPPPELEPGIRNENDNMPQLRKMQIDLLVNSLINDMTRVATLQFTKSVGQARMHWLGIDESHHTLSHEPDANDKAQEMLTKINRWFCEQLAYFVQRLDETPEPGGQGSMLDNTLVVWGNELGKGNSHTLDNIPFVLIGGGCGFKLGRSLHFDKAAHNRLLLAMAHGFGHHIDAFGNPKLCDGGALSLG